MKDKLTLKEKKLVVELQVILVDLFKKAYPKEQDVETYILLGLKEFAETFHDDQGIQAMSDFIEYATKHKMYWRDILTTCMHDINHRADRFMLPRTSSYLGRTE